MDIDVLDEIIDKPTSPWSPFSKKEFKVTITNCNNASIPGLNKLSWSHLKIILKDDKCLNSIIHIANACIELEYWPLHFKRFTTVIIPKLNKKSYDTPKYFRPIILLNTMGKLIEKVIRLLTLIMKKAGFNNHIISFFSNYLMDRKTNYFWNNFTSPIFNVNVGMGQGSVLSPILSALCLSPFIYILENHLKNVKIPISIISFLDNGLFISQNKSINISNSYLFYSYNVLTKLLEKFSLIIEHSKTEIFHFNRFQGVFNPPPLNLTLLGEFILWLNNSWKYLGFIFNRKLMFYQHINFYANKSISTVKCMKLLGNSNHGINPLQKHFLYRTCVLPITLYEFQLWFYNCAPIMYHLKALEKM